MASITIGSIGLLRIVNSNYLRELFKLQICGNTYHYVGVVFRLVDTVWCDVGMRVSHSLVLSLAIEPRAGHIAK